MNYQYIEDFTEYCRRPTNEISIGGIPMGGKNPVRLQSMTNTSTSDIKGTVEQIIRLRDAGADYVRMTISGRNDLKALTDIVDELKKRKCRIPLIADIHFNPGFALESSRIIDKVRINPGNYIDRKSFDVCSYTDNEYQEELRKLEEKFSELLVACRENKTALRIGTNHGSLSDRIMSRYGDTPEGMVESSMEFLRICQRNGFDDVVVSMKASNTRVMVYATRLLVVKMREEKMNFPLHLGVTEAGEGEDGRIKSAVGIGALLVDGIGDTIRVSLTEDPELEIPVAKKLSEHILHYEGHSEILDFGRFPKNPYNYSRRICNTVSNIGADLVPVVVHRSTDVITVEKLNMLGWKYSRDGQWGFDDMAPDYIWVDDWPGTLPDPPGNRVLLLSATGDLDRPGIIPVIEYCGTTEFKNKDAAFFLHIRCNELTGPFIRELDKYKNLVIILSSTNQNTFADMRSAIFRMMNADCRIPVILEQDYEEDLIGNLQIKAAADMGGLFIDGLGDGICIMNTGNIDDHSINSTSFGILQAGRVRISKTEFISCPSCGRTLFDLQRTTKEIRERTHHLKGLKIGIMGCIVNGPGEMADADYGYVGAGKGRITLYKKKDVVKRNIKESEAVDMLIQLIKENGDWKEP